MKKYLFLAVAATALFASCSNDEVVEMNPQNAIGFSTFVDKSTRATDATNDNLAEISVYGWRGTEQIFDAQEVTKNGNAWSYSPLKYWVGGAKYTFEAIAPAASDENGITFNAVNGASTITFKSNSETDLIYAAAEKELTEYDANLTASPGTVDFTFEHLLSRVKFTFKNGFAAESEAKITVTNVKISNAGTTAEYSTSTGTWATATATDAITFASTNVANVAASAEAETEHKYLIPASVVSNYTLSFDVAMIQGNATSTYSHTGITLPTNFTLEKGKSYDLVAELNVNNINPEGQLFPIEFTVTEVTDWVEQDAVNVEVPAANN